MIRSGYAIDLTADEIIMRHRHLNHQRFTLAAIDDVIARGCWQDWAELRRALIEDQSISDKIERACRHHVVDPYAQRYHFWLNYVKARQFHKTP